MTKSEPAKTFDPAIFRRVETWVFDLDNTLYPPDSDLWPRIDARITTFLIDMFGLDGLSSRALQKYYYKQYGTTLNGLMAEYGMEPEKFLAFVHDIDRTSLAPNPGLAHAIEALPGRKLILTNGSHAHALATIAQLGVDHLFDGVFGIEAADYLPKPALQTFQRFFERHGVDPSKAAMFEDIVHNLEAPHDEGMLTVLVRPKLDATDHREDWEKSTHLPPHVDYVTDDLESFLRRLVASESTG